MPSAKKTRILFIVPYVFDLAPGQRFRYEQYLTILKEQGIKYKIVSFLSERTNSILYDEGKKVSKAFGVLGGFVRRFLLMFRLSSYDFIFVFREATPIGPPIFEWMIAKVWRKKIIYDFDDAIWLANTSEQNKIVASVKWHHKVESICRWSYKISAGNQYLADYASQFNDNVVVNPTTIDTEKHHKPTPRSQNSTFTIGWTGTHSTMPYLLPILPILDRLYQRHQFKLLVISNQHPDFERDYLEFRKWQKPSEIEDLQRMDIGIMPLTDDQWAKGKCGFKALQYMALRIPALISPVGVNTEIVDDGINGFLCSTEEDWTKAMSKFFEDPALINRMADACRKKVVEHYSVISNTENFLGLFR
ncbi:MAG: glycosyltransferase family 4 protein [Bacteroidota bacterium]